MRDVTPTMENFCDVIGYLGSARNDELGEVEGGVLLSCHFRHCVETALARLRHGTAQHDVHVDVFRLLTLQQTIDHPLPRVRDQTVLAAVRLVRVVLY